MTHTFTFISTLLLAPLAALLCLTPSISAQDRKPVLVESKRIWDKAQEQLLHRPDPLSGPVVLLLPRRASRHAGDNGKVRVLHSPDGASGGPRRR
jgi:hypothetical protein